MNAFCSVKPTVPVRLIVEFFICAILPAHEWNVIVFTDWLLFKLLALLWCIAFVHIQRKNTALAVVFNLSDDTFVASLTHIFFKPLIVHCKLKDDKVNFILKQVVLYTRRTERTVSSAHAFVHVLYCRIAFSRLLL